MCFRRSTDRATKRSASQRRDDLVSHEITRRSLSQLWSWERAPYLLPSESFGAWAPCDSGILYPRLPPLLRTSSKFPSSRFLRSQNSTDYRSIEFTNEFRKVRGHSEINKGFGDPLRYDISRTTISRFFEVIWRCNGIFETSFWWRVSWGPSAISRSSEWIFTLKNRPDPSAVDLK